MILRDNSPLADRKQFLSRCPIDPKDILLYNSINKIDKLIDKILTNSDLSNFELVINSEYIIFKNLDQYNDLTTRIKSNLE